MVPLLAAATLLIAAAVHRPWRSPAVAAQAPGEARQILCPLAEESRPAPNPGPVLLPAAAEAPSGADYRQRLSTTPLGWPRLDAWCVWVQPVSDEGPGRRWESPWLIAVESALEQWGGLVPIQRVTDPGAAQIRIERRRPPLRFGADGRTRASHGRASLALMEVRRGGRWRLEPAVTVQLGSDQRPAALQATALHELGHAVGLWGHSDAAGDAMAAVPGPKPVLQLTERDRETLRWLYNQPTRFGAPLQSND